MKSFQQVILSSVCGLGCGGRLKLLSAAGRLMPNVAVLAVRALRSIPLPLVSVTVEWCGSFWMLGDCSSRLCLHSHRKTRLTSIISR